MVESIIDLTQCHPHYTQQLCHELWYIAVIKETKKADLEDINTAVEKVLINQNDAYLSIWDASTKAEGRVLMALASGETSLYSQKIIKEYDLVSQSHVQRSLKGLERKEIIERVNGKYDMDIFLKNGLKEDYCI